MNYNKLFLVDNSLDMNCYLMNGGKIVIVSEEVNPQMISSMGALQGSALLPPFEAISSLVDGDINTFKLIYGDYLAAKEQDFYLSAIVTAAMSGIPIGFIFGPFDNNMNVEIFQTFATYMANAFGIVIEGLGQQFYTFPTYDAINLDKIYSYGLIPWNEYLFRYPKEYNLNQQMIPKLISDSGLQYQMDINGYMNLFNRMRFNMESPQPMKHGIEKGNV